MKKIQYSQIIILSIAFLSVVLYSCVKQDFKLPTQTTPNAQLTANATIAQIVLLHTIKDKLDTIVGDTIIQGIVIGNDESGNIYKYMVIQDATAGIVINVDLGDYNTEYKIGQKVFVKCKGLVIGDYSGLPQLGLPYLDGTWKVGRIPAVYISKYIYKDGLPNDTVTPKIISNFSQIMASDINRLVTLENVSFPESGLLYTEPYFTTDRVLVDSSGIGDLVLVRTSNYASFATDTVPDGIGKITGILSYYKSGTRFRYQLIIRNIKEVGTFTPSLNLIETFASSLGSFTQYSVTGDQIWTASSGSGKTFAKMSGYVSPNYYYANEDWLISKSFDFTKFSAVKFSFESYMRYGSTNDGTLKAYYSTNYSSSGNPNSATWTELPGAIYSPLHSSSWTDPWTSSGEIDLSSINNQKVYIAFKFTCSTVGVPTWEITNVKLKGTTAK